MPTTLDTRPLPDFLAARLPDSANIPFDELASRVHELPTSSTPIHLLDNDPARAAAAATFLSQRGHPIHLLPFNPAQLTSSGPSQSRLWQPNPFLVEALSVIGPPPPNATALDIACGTGRDAVYLAIAGYQVTAIDHLPDALTRATDLAARYATTIHPLVHNLEHDNTLPAPPADLVCVFRYLHRPLFPALRDAVRPGGHLVYETFHERNLQTGRSPRNPAHLLRTGELAAAFHDFEILLSTDALNRDGRFFSHLLARRPRATPPSPPLSVGC